MRHFIPSLFLITFLSCSSNAQLSIEGTPIDTNTVIQGLDIPWEMVWGPDNWIWFTERYGVVSRVDPENGTREVLLDLSGTVHQQGESGLLGLALHPDFPLDNRIYLVYTYKDGNSILERLVHYDYVNGALENESILIDQIPGNTTHDGSRIAFGPDGKLYMTTGDAQNQQAPQDLESLNGKLLRVNPDGSVPEDNPFGSYVWSLGHRNAQGLYFANDGTLYSSEHGPNTDDEINILVKGGNYGWEPVHGYCDLASEQSFCEDSNVIEPIYAWTPTVATSDIAIYESDAIPGLTGKLLLTTLKEQDLRVLSLSEDGGAITEEAVYFDEWWGRLRDVLVSPDGRVYIATNGFSWGEAGTFRHSIIEVSSPAAHGLFIPGTKGGSLRFVPNPSFSTPRLYAEHLGNDDRYTLLDPLGRVVGMGAIENFKDLDLQPGVYQMTLQSSYSIRSGQFVVGTN